MSEQPPVQPPRTPPQQPATSPGSNPPTQPMTAAYAAPPAGPTTSPAPEPPPRANKWHQATATSGGRWALALSAAAVVLLLFLGVAVTSFLVLRNHDRVNLLGDRQATRSLGQYGPGNMRGLGHGNGNGKASGEGDGENGRNQPGLRGGQGQGLGGLGNLLGGTALHGEVTANVGGTVQALVFHRGDVTAVSDTAITLRSSDGFTGTYGLNATTRSRGATPVKGGQAFVLARASDKVAITTLSMPATVGQAPSN